MNELKFWSMIEEAWNSDPGLLTFRSDVLTTLESEEAKEEFEEKHGDTAPSIPFYDRFEEALTKQLDGLSQDELLAFDRILERKLYDIDREDVHEYVDGSDDGFLYCRGFIVAIGQRYYEAIDKDPSKAMFDWEAEGVTYISAHLYEEKFGEMPDSDICRETGSNTEGWGDG